MFTSDLVFFPSLGAGHLPPTVELAKLLLGRDPRISVTIVIMNLPFGPKHNTEETVLSTPRLRLIDIPTDDSLMPLITPKTFHFVLIEYHKPLVRNIIQSIIDSDSLCLAGFVVDMFCIGMMDVANEFGVPTFTYFTSSAAMLGMMFHLQAKRDNEGYDVTELKNELKNIESGLLVPSFVNPLHANVLPEILSDKEGGSKMFHDLAKGFRESKGVIVNTFQELESHALEYLSVENILPKV